MQARLTAAELGLLQHQYAAAYKPAVSTCQPVIPPLAEEPSTELVACAGDHCLAGGRLVRLRVVRPLTRTHSLVGSLTTRYIQSFSADDGDAREMCVGILALLANMAGSARGLLLPL